MLTSSSPPPPPPSPSPSSSSSAAAASSFEKFRQDRCPDVVFGGIDPQNTPKTFQKSEFFDFSKSLSLTLQEPKAPPGVCFRRAN